MEAPVDIRQEIRVSSADQLATYSWCRMGRVKRSIVTYGQNNKRNIRSSYNNGLLPAVQELEVEKL